MSELEEKSALASARDNGMKRGEKIGREQGKKIERGKIAKELLKLDMPIKQIIQATGLKEEEIMKIKNQI